MAFDATKFAEQYSPTALSSGFDATKFASKYGTVRQDLKTSSGLYNLASQKGYQADADRILQSQTGEKTKEIFSGGFISDTFDTLNALQYGVVGLLKGKSFSEGVRTRQSFTDKDALGDKGIPGMIAGVLLDIAFDPLTYIAPATIAKKIPVLGKALKLGKEAIFGKMATKAIEGTGKTYQALEGGSKLGKYLGSKFAWMFGADPIFKETFERSVKNIAVETNAIADLGKVVSKMQPETAGKILVRDEAGRFARKPFEQLAKELTPDELVPVQTFYNKIDDLGKQATDLGLLSKEKYEENIGEYIKNAYTEYELAKGKGFFAKPVGIPGIKKRVEGLTQEQMKELGQIDNPAYLLFKSVFDLTKNVENAKLLSKVADDFGTDVAQEGFTKIATGDKWGKLAGKYVPDNISQYLNEVIEPAKDTLTKSTVANFKFFKVVMNPGTHARNIVSNKILNYWKLGMNPLDPRVIATDAEAMAEIAKGVGKWTDEARPLGYNLDTFAAQEMKTLLNSPEAMLWGKTQKAWGTMKEKLGNIYQGEENWAKLSAYIFNRKHKGLNPEDAWKAAESATFNYAQVTPFVRKLRESLFGFPFITFTVKATPVALETIAKKPVRVSVLGKIKQAMEQQSDLKETERERASEPSWVKDGFYIKLPMKDKHGRSAYFDLTYILPFGDLLAGNFFERGISRETGLPESQISAATKKSPFINLVSELGRNQDFYGNRIWKDSDPQEKQLGDLMRHLSKTYLPPLISDNLPGGYNEKGEQQQRGIVGAIRSEKEPKQQRTLMQEMLRMIGAKIQPIDADIQETYQEWNKKKALQNLLIDKGELNDFNITYQPK